MSVSFIIEFGKAAPRYVGWYIGYSGASSVAATTTCRNLRKSHPINFTYCGRRRRQFRFFVCDLCPMRRRKFLFISRNVKRRVNSFDGRRQQCRTLREQWVGATSQKLRDHKSPTIKLFQLIVLLVV